MSLDSLASLLFDPIRIILSVDNPLANLLKSLMSKKIQKKVDYINANVADVSKKELLEAIRKVEERNKLIDEKSRFTSQSLSVRAGQ